MGEVLVRVFVVMLVVMLKVMLVLCDLHFDVGHRHRATEWLEMTCNQNKGAGVAERGQSKRGPESQNMGPKSPKIHPDPE